MTEPGSMNSGFAKLKGRSRLPDPPVDGSNNLAAPEAAPPEVVAENPAPTVPREPAETRPLESKPRIDGRIRLRKDRTEALSTKIKPRHRELLMELADAYESTLSETLERAIEALEAQARKEGKTLS